VDTSALIAILRRETDAKALAEAVEKAATVKISSATFFEACLVVDRMHDPRLAAEFDTLCGEIGLTFVDFNEHQARIARTAYQKYGRGSGHGAKLNFGDCFAYALAKTTGEPLLYKGKDFIQTDVRSALK